VCVYAGGTVQSELSMVSSENIFHAMIEGPVVEVGAGAFAKYSINYHSD
jgi:hypothetical protein